MADNQITPFQLTDQFIMDNFNQRINETNTALRNKAPAGYGLGNGYSGYIDDFNTKVKTGWYISAAGSSNAPVEPGTGNSLAFGVLRVECRDSHIYQFYSIERFGNSISMRRISTDGGTSWGEWEYENPRMQLGVEYRTTERWNNLPVYVKLIYGGKSASGGRTTIPYGVTVSNLVEQVITVGAVQQPFAISDNNHKVFVDACTSSAVTVYTGSSMGDKDIYVRIKYTKG